jgi:hypothetical protein
MRKVLFGLIAAAVLVAAGIFGFLGYVQHRAEGEIDAALEPIRAGGGKASHGKVTYDVWHRVLTVADFVIETATQPSVRVAAASITASGLSQPDASRFVADNVEMTDFEVTLDAGWKFPYKAPKLIIKDLSGPAARERSPVSAAGDGAIAFALDQFKAVTASTVTIPGLTAAISMTLPTVMTQTVDYTYTNLTLSDLKQGNFATITADHSSFTGNVQQNGKSEKIGGEFARLAAYDVNAAAMAALFDPARANDDNYVRLYRQIKLGTYTARLQQGVRMQVDGFTMDDLGMRPSKVRLPELMKIIASMPSPGAKPTTAQSREMMEKVAGIYEGIRVGNAEMRGFSVETPQGPLKLAAIHFNLDNGRISEFAIEGVDARSPQGPVKLDRFAIKSFDIAGLMRLSSQFMDPSQMATPDRALGLLHLVEAVELKGFVGPYKNTHRTVTVDALSLDWGRFAGPIPSQAHLLAKFTSPIDPSDPLQQQLIMAGMREASVDFDLGAAWTEDSGAFVLAPVKLDLGDLLDASARFSLASVPREIFSDPLHAASLAAQIEAGPIEITLRDLGGVDLAVGQYARSQNVPREAARQAIVDSLASSAKARTDNAEVLALADALGRFIATPRGSLVIKLTPLGKVPALQLAQVMKTEPMLALAQFKIEVSTGL